MYKNILNKCTLRTLIIIIFVIIAFRYLLPHKEGKINDDCFGRGCYVKCRTKTMDKCGHRTKDTKKCHKDTKKKCLADCRHKCINSANE